MSLPSGWPARSDAWVASFTAGCCLRDKSCRACHRGEFRRHSTSFKLPSMAQTSRLLVGSRQNFSVFFWQAEAAMRRLGGAGLGRGTGTFVLPRPRTTAFRSAKRGTHTHHSKAFRPVLSSSTSQAPNKRPEKDRFVTLAAIAGCNNRPRHSLPSSRENLVGPWRRHSD